MPRQPGLADLLGMRTQVSRVGHMALGQFTSNLFNPYSLARQLRGEIFKKYLDVPENLCSRC